MRTLISKQDAFKRTASPELAMLGPTAGAVGIADWMASERMDGIQESLSENTIEAFNAPAFGEINMYDEVYEHLQKTAHPDDFPAPICLQTLKSNASWWNVTQLGSPGGNPATLYVTSYDLNTTDTTMYCYLFSATGPNGFVIPPGGGILRITDAPQETIKFGSFNIATGFNTLARNWGGPGTVGQNHRGHDYEANPNPPPPTIIARHHDNVDVQYPGMALNYFIATSAAFGLLAIDRVPYAPKGSRCGVFMPIILRFLAAKRRRANSSLGVVTVHPATN